MSDSLSSRSSLLGLLLVLIVLSHALVYVPCLQDDAFISFRYAENLVAGHGLVFNPGERVEGFTNLSWTLLMALPIALGQSPETFAVVAGLLAVIGLVLLTWRIAKHLMPGQPFLALIPPLLLAGDGPMLMEAVQGLETSFFALLVLGMWWSSVREAEDESAFPTSALFGALATLTRPEGILLYGGLQGIRFLHQRGRTTARDRKGWWIVLAVLGGQLAFRLAYYGQPLPNTFYAKVGGGAVTWARGLDYLGRFAASHPVFCLLALGGVVALRKGLGAVRNQLLLGLCLGWFVYLVTVGGDFKITWRFMHAVMAPMALLAGVGLARLWEVLGQRGPWQGKAAVLSLLLAWGLLDAGPESRRSTQEARFRGEVTFMRQAVGMWLRANVPPDTVLAIHSSGVVPYYSGLPTIDMWGLSDLHIARREMPHMGRGMPGHEKSDPAYVFERQPQIYLPEEFLVTPEFHPLPVPGDFPPDFEHQYDGCSVTLERGVLNFFERAGEREICPG